MIRRLRGGGREDRAGGAGKVIVQKQIQKSPTFPHSGFGEGSCAGEGVTGERKVRDHLREIKSVTPSLVSGP